ncbi:MAG: ATP-binding cassette domain-containing protein [Chitinivibrionales bacterium]|nr:ATP-binding cassette domain-containing protein [Chitinivibrionales bacterium]
MDPVVAFDKVCFSYTDQEVLHDVSFEVEPGSFIGVVGPNGAGKTTLLKLIPGLLKPGRGAIKVFGNSPRKARPHISYVMQHMDFDEKFPATVDDIVIMGRVGKQKWGPYTAADKKVAQQSLEKVGMSGLGDRPFAQLSGGQRQRALIAQALGMAIGVTSIMKTPGYSQDLMSYLFGSILMVSPTDLGLMFILDIIIITGVVLFYNRILAVCFHEEAARARGVPVGLYTFLILIFTALTTVLLAQVVGIVMVIALLSIPAATVSRFTNRLSTMMISATVLSLVISLGGLVISYGPELPVGATIIELAGVCYLGAILFKK